jgi:uncharacterized protein with GYD domain
MLFVAIHEHAPESCPADDPAPVHKLANAKHIRDSGVKVLGSYIAPPEHQLFFILEADDYSQVVRFFRPLMKIGTPDIVPVQTLAEALGIFPARQKRGTRKRR